MLEINTSIIQIFTDFDSKACRIRLDYFHFVLFLVGGIDQRGNR